MFVPNGNSSSHLPNGRGDTQRAFEARLGERMLSEMVAKDNNPISLSNFDFDTQSMHDLCMATKTISIEIDAYELLVRERKDPKESFSRVIRRVLSERPALTAGDLLDAMKAFEGRGAGPRRRRSRDAAA